MEGEDDIVWVYLGACDGVGRMEDISYKPLVKPEANVHEDL
jgi:hypothetical protein